VGVTVARVALDVLPDLTNFGKELSGGISKATPHAKEEAGKTGAQVGRKFGESAGRSAHEESKPAFGRAGRQAGEKFGEEAKSSVKHLSKSIFAGIGALGAAEVLGKSLEAGDELEAANIKIEGSFGESSETVSTWAETMATKYGVAKSAAENSAGTFGQMLHAMGETQANAAGMSMKMSELTENVAKFNNANPEAVQSAFVAAMRGRGKALMALGINLDSTTVAAEAMRHGIVKTSVDQTKVTAAQDTYNAAVAKQSKIDKDTKSTAVQRATALHQTAAAHDALAKAMGGVIPKLTQSQKGEASYYAILDGTKNQQNAVAETTNTLAQRKRILGAEVSNLEAKLGLKLFPVMSKIAAVVTDKVIPAISSLGQWISRNRSWLVPLIVIVGGATLAYKGAMLAVAGFEKVMKLSSATQAAASKIMKLFKSEQVLATEANVAYNAALAAGATETEAATAAQLELDGAMDANPIGLVVIAVAALALGFYEAWKHSKTFREIITGAFKAVKGVVLGVINWFRKDFVGFFTKTIPHTFHSFVSGVKSAFNSVWSFLKKWGPLILVAVLPVVGIPLLIAQHFRQIIGWLRSVWTTVVHDVSAFVDKIVTAILWLPKKILGMQAAMTDAGLHLMGSLFDGIKHALGAAGSFALDIAKNIWNGITGFINTWLIDPIKNFHFKIGIGPYHHTFQPFNSFPELPKLAAGGMTTGAMTAVIGDNRSGNEAVLPLDHPNTINALATAIRSANNQNGAGPMQVHGGRVEIGADSAGRLTAWVRDLVIGQAQFTSSVARMNA
jgi:hypothetical protein